MSRWDAEPTSFQRWIVRHATGFRVTALLLLALTICGLVYDLVTGGLHSVHAGLASGVTSALLLLIVSRDVSRFVDKCDSAKHQGSNSK